MIVSTIDSVKLVFIENVMLDDKSLSPITGRYEKNGKKITYYGSTFLTDMGEKQYFITAENYSLFTGKDVNLQFKVERDEYARKNKIKLYAVIETDQKKANNLV